MKRYVVTLQREERGELAAITRKGSHQSQRVINALVLLNCNNYVLTPFWKHRNGVEGFED